VIAAALTGFAVVRMYFSLFCGTRATTLHLPLLRREVLVYGALTSLLVMGGVLPPPIIASRMKASELLLRERVVPSMPAPSPPRDAARHE
jgi:hypothetical protein